MQQDRAEAVLTGMRMLVNDRSPATVRLIQEHAYAWGIECDAETNSAATLVALKTAAACGRPYDIALIEISNHEPGGLTLGRAIKANPAFAATRVLGMYAIGARPDERRTRAAGIRGLLAKPIKQTQLVHLLSMMRQSPHNARPAQSARKSAKSSKRAIASKLPADLRASTRILLVEDSPLNQRVQMKILERIGFSAVTVSNGEEALAALEQHPYDIVLMDCQMPGLDGYNATREIRRRETRGQRTVIIGVTANALSGDREECLATGMDDYVAMPVAPEDLAATLEKWLTPITMA
jgi:two-component system sensor histidine kinase/response regulator